MLVNILFFPAYVLNRIIFALRKVEVGKKVKILGMVKVCRRGKLIIGDGATIQSSRYANPLSNKTVFEIKKGAEVIVGKNVGISGAIIKSHKRIIIEDNVMIGGDVLIMDTDSHPIDYNDRVNNRNHKTKEAEIVLGEGCFIGARSIILKGVTIGKHSIVSAGSVVNRSIPDGEIWGGNPATYIKKVEKKNDNNKSTV